MTSTKSASTNGSMLVTCDCVRYEQYTCSIMVLSSSSIPLSSFSCLLLSFPPFIPSLSPPPPPHVYTCRIMVLSFSIPLHIMNFFSLFSLSPSLPSSPPPPSPHPSLSGSQHMSYMQSQSFSSDCLLMNSNCILFSFVLLLIYIYIYTSVTTNDVRMC